MHCLNHAVFLLCGLNLDVQNHPSLVSDLGNKATKKQVAHGKHRTPKSSGLFATDPPPLTGPIKACHCGCWGGPMTYWHALAFKNKQGLGGVVVYSYNPSLPGA